MSSIQTTPKKHWISYAIIIIALGVICNIFVNLDQYYHNRNHPLVLYFVDKMNHALQQHVQHSNQQSIHNPNLEFIQLQKWIPREWGFRLDIS